MKTKPIKNVVTALAECNDDAYPSVYRLSIILACLPVHSAASEISFSTLRRINTYLRNAISENRLDG